MNELMTFKNADFGEVRTLLINNEPWFVGKDVASVLGYANTKDALKKRVENEDKKDGVAIRDPMGRYQKPVLINESGLYSLILSSKLESAKKFKRWVTSEVLPTLRKTGQYSMQPKLPMTYKEALLQLVAQVEANEKLELENAEMKPKASYYDIVLNCKKLIPIKEIAKDYGWSGQKLNKYLHDKGVQYKQSGTWLLYQKHADKGYTGTKTQLAEGKDGEQHAHIHTYWTQKGRLFIYDLLKNDGILPTIEEEKGE